MERVLVAYSEIGTKGKSTRPKFEKQLIQNIRNAGAKFKVSWEHGRIILLPQGPGDLKILEAKLAKTFGVRYYAAIRSIAFDSIDGLAGKIAAMYGERVKGRKFRVTAHRVGSHGFSSIDAQRIIGKKLVDCGGKVDLENFEVEIRVTIKGSSALVFDKVNYGPGGLPIGSEGNVLVLFSGGIDSPVAAWHVMKRGCYPTFLFINLGGKDMLDKVYAVYRKLSYEWGNGDFEFLAADGRKVVEKIRKEVAPEYRQVVLKKAFYVIAEKVCRQQKLDAVVTGESIGQVSTQTLRNLWGIQSGANVLFLRPLIGMDKEYSVKMAQTIGTYDLSILVGELCNISQGSVKLSAKPWQVEKEFAKVASVVDEVYVTKVTKRQAGRKIIVPKNAVVIDVDSEKVDYAKLDKSRFYVVVCKDGVNASLECELLRGLGFRCTSRKKSAQG